jgi:solute carrier family 25 protein 42
MGASIFGITIYHGSSFFIFTKLKEQVKKKSPSNYQKWYVDFSLGAISAAGQLVAYPFDVIRKRMQGQALLLDKRQIAKLSDYKELLSTIYHK